MGGAMIETNPFPFKQNIASDETHLFLLHPLLWRRVLIEAGFFRLKIDS
jgi:hypothetical protein